VNSIALKRTREPRQLTSGLGKLAQPSLSVTGEIAFSSVSVASDLWMLPFDGSSGKITGEPLPVTRDDSTKPDFRLSADGRLLVYENDRGEKAEIRIRDFRTGKEIVVASGRYPRVSGDGKHVVYSHWDGETRAYYLVNVGDNVPRKTEIENAMVWALSSEGSEVLAGTAPDNRSLRSIDVASGRSTLIVPTGRYDIIYGPSFSPDDRWVSLRREGGAGGISNLRCTLSGRRNAGAECVDRDHRRQLVGVRTTVVIQREYALFPLRA
jgi:hypothetical protein